MDSSSSMASRRRTFELPKSTPDEGLVEWASKIKAIQQEVDEDEEAERRRLQEEIERSRMERARRRSALTVSSDMPKKVVSPQAEPSGPFRSSTEPKDHRSEALQKLVATNSSTEQAIAGSAKLFSSSATQKPGMSLAEFIGGKGDGPRLKKHTPQADAHDPKLFEQTRPQGPHPIFGLPAGAVRRVPSKPSLQDLPTTEASTEETKSNRPAFPNAPVTQPPKVTRESSTKVTDVSPVEIYKKSNIPPDTAVGRPSDKDEDVSVQSRPVPSLPPKPAFTPSESPKQTTFGASKPSAPVENTSASRPAPPLQPKPAFTPSESPKQTTLVGASKPSAIPAENTSTSRPSPSPVVSSKPGSLAEMIGGRGSGPRLSKPANVDSSENRSLSTQGRALPGLTASPRFSSSPAAPSPSVKPTTLRSTSLGTETTDTSAVNPVSISPPSRPASTSSFTAPSLARPIQPNVAAPPSAIATASPTPAPAFLRASPSTQELHPSLTRLQGRGLVNQRVRAASQLFNDNTIPEQQELSSSPPTPTKRSVLDRWQPGLSSSSPPSPSPTPPSSTGPKPGLYRELPGLSTGASRSTRPSFSQAKSNDKVDDIAAAPVRLPGMAGTRTLPPKVAATDRPSPPVIQVTEERGRSNNEASTPKGMTTAPLNHPTRDRARKPRKGPTHASKDMPSTEKLSELSIPIDIPETLVKQSPAPNKFEQSYEHEPSSTPSFKPSRGESSLPFPKPSSNGSVVQGDKEVTKGSKFTPLGEYRRPSSGPEPPKVAEAPRPVTPVKAHSPEEAPISPRSRIPSTGNRATVMDVAQALLEHEQHIREASFTPEPEPVTESPPQEETEEEEAPRPDVRSIIAGWGRGAVTPSPPVERRRSSHESRFVVSTLPPLMEVKTPAETPQASLSRGFAQTEQRPPKAQEVHQALKEWSGQTLEVIEDKPLQETQSESEDEIEPEVLPEIVFSPPEERSVEPALSVAKGQTLVEPQEPKVAKVDARIPEPTAKVASEDEVITLTYQDTIPPAFNLNAILKETPFNPNPKTQTLSVDVLLISGSTAAPVTQEPNVFYDTEIIGIVHRSKDKTGELVSNQVWIWKGRNSQFGPREERKATELAERYGTTPVHCSHASEPAQLIHVLGGVLAIRQGIRAHWSSENTGMHRVLRVADSIFVDEVDLGIWNLCSAYSYCLAILGTVYVWHGRGSTEDERKVAATYAQSLTNSPSSVVEFDEGNEDEMFWLILGNEGYANADFWKFKDQLERVGPRFFSIDSTNRKLPIQVLAGTPALEFSEGGVFVVDCRLEVFVVVTPGARGRRADIQLALFLAQNISAAIAHKRPFNPPIHVLVLPSKLPLELRAAIRLCDELALNDGSVPDHMNLVSITDAFDQMQRRTWLRSQLSDNTFLPLGVDPSMI
ncbi:hypothetical protein M422DRAFT_246441 [Sphaerobolus stellatus SS14]|nr:hypothetical protein M422DRAFT_246441 [Sphaerobolus stellatus SS14]